MLPPGIVGLVFLLSGRELFILLPAAGKAAGCSAQSRPCGQRSIDESHVDRRRIILQPLSFFSLFLCMSEKVVPRSGSEANH